MEPKTSAAMRSPHTWLVATALVILGLCVHGSLASLHSLLRTKFSAFHFLSPRHLEVRVKRDLVGRVSGTAVVIPAFGRRMTLWLHQGSSLPRILSPNASLLAVHQNGTTSDIVLDPQDFYQGVLVQRSPSWVSAVRHEGLWSIHVRHASMAFSLEPLSFHLGPRSGSPRRMVLYQQRHLHSLPPTAMAQAQTRTFAYRDDRSKSKGNKGHSIRQKLSQSASFDHRARSPRHVTHHKLLRVARHEPQDKAIETGTSTFQRDAEDNKGAMKTSKQDYETTTEQKTEVACDVLALSDFRFFKSVGERSAVKTAKLLAQIYHVVDEIFSHTDFDSEFKVRVRIRRMEVYTEPGGSGPERFFNVDVKTSDGNKLITLLTKIPYLREYCVAHLSTQRDLLAHRLGVAVTGFGGGIKKGICGGFFMGSYNVGASTVTNEDRLTPLRIYYLVVAHELGHNFGATHDTTDSPPECRPTEAKGGHYLMWATSSNGNSPNNNKFSPCSKHMISDLLNVMKTNSPFRN